MHHQLSLRRGRTISTAAGNVEILTFMMKQIHPIPFGLPPLMALRAFEATARLASFKDAAAELFVTPTAISHQVRKLESHLGLRVLERTPRSVTLTPAGAALYDAVASSFTEIARVSSLLRRGPAPAVLTLSATSAFLSQWLVPRLADLRRTLPELDLRLHASETAEPLNVGRIDVAIRYGRGPFAGVEATALTTDVFVPVCSPKLMISRPDDLREAKLIHVDGRRAPRPAPDWARWCDQAGLTGVDTLAGLRVTDSLHAVQAALACEGVAIVSRVLAADALASGLLVQPFSDVLRGETYHFVCPPGLGVQTDVAALRAWFENNLGPRPS